MPREAKITSKHGKPLGTFDDDVHYFFKHNFMEFINFLLFQQNIYIIYILIREKKNIF